MKQLAKAISLLLALGMLMCVFAGCADKTATAPDTGSEPSTQQPADSANDPSSENDAAASAPQDTADYAGGEANVTTTEDLDTFIRKTEAGHLVVGANTVIESFDPTAASNALMTSVYDPLIIMDPETKALVPGLAESWEWADDYLTCTFHLREATFSDGTPITAADVYYSLHRMATSTSMQSSSYAYIDFDASGCPDDQTFVMVMKSVYAQIEYVLSTGWIYPEHFAETATAEEWWNQPVTSGAFTVLENVDGAYCYRTYIESFHSMTGEKGSFYYVHFAE